MFGAKHEEEIAKLERQLDGAKRARAQAEAELAQLRAQLHEQTRQRERLAAHVERHRPRQGPPRSPTTLPGFETIEAPYDIGQDWVRARYEISGPRSQLATLDLLLRTIHSACSWGSTVFYSMMVDGDGGGGISVLREGEVGELQQHEERWLYAARGEAPERPGHLEGAEVYFDEDMDLLTFDIV